MKALKQNQLVLAEAKQWIGTPYQHQTSCKGIGTDCLGLIRGVWRSVLGAEPMEIPAYSQDWSEPAGLESLWNSAADVLTEKDPADAKAGDVLLFRMRQDAVAKHLGILGSDDPYQTFVHAYSGHGVVESPLSAPWARRIVAVFAFPERID
ncbi:NlpC/P60 family protein [Aliiroseovarius lamellibrachiae]|mgnify:CR=1 FL=1|uniref:NlpC/P60 family protein n=1 Tax=Aliiroseovarius lamellibrachiae TaxID=1924933 RepID=UPI001BDFDB0F|nr:NlpC/P60 family protein [Aliiroseovarius lamellibrachiae]MBT2131127.1 C40 family peptidase [Aliiroseovarius lamellibrachiae]